MAATIRSMNATPRFDLTGDPGRIEDPGACRFPDID
jgi:hypothetical protein